MKMLQKLSRGKDNKATKIRQKILQEEIIQRQKREKFKVLEKPAEETEALQEMGVIKKFDYRVRKDSESMSDKEKMDKGFNGKTYSNNGLDWDF